MTIRIDKRFGNGMSLLLAYTAGKEIDNASVGGELYRQHRRHSPGFLQLAERALDRFLRCVATGRDQLRLRISVRPEQEAPEQPSESAGHDGQRLADQRHHYLPDRIADLYYRITNNTNIGTSSQRANSNGKSAFIDHSGQNHGPETELWFDPTVFCNLLRLPSAISPGCSPTFATRVPTAPTSRFSRTPTWTRTTLHAAVEGGGLWRVQPLQSGRSQYQHHQRHHWDHYQWQGTRSIQVAAKILF